MVEVFALRLFHDAKWGWVRPHHGIGVDETRAKELERAGLAFIANPFPKMAREPLNKMAPAPEDK